MNGQTKVIIIDNVNNLSGAPMVAKSIAKIFRSPIFCIRQATIACYNAASFGIESNKRVHYVSGLILMLMNFSFLRKLFVSNVVICNTSLAFPFVIFSRLLGKFTICVVHECAKKNILYKVALFFSINFAKIIVTPSRSAYLDLGIPIKKWKVINNSISVEYSYPIESISSISNDIYVLFAGGGRLYKGGKIFKELSSYAANKNKNIHFHAVGDSNYIKYVGESSKLTVDIYKKYHFMLVLTDNSIWKETFGLVGCESAACRCVPLFSDRFAYSELWVDYLKPLYLPVYDAKLIFSQIEEHLIDRNAFDNLRNSVRNHALRLTDSLMIERCWDEIMQIPSGNSGKI